MNISEIQKRKDAIPFVMLTAYDFPTGRLCDEAGVDIVLVGDSLANVVLGLESTKDVGMAEMLHHTKAVRRAVKKAALIADMPYEAYQKDPANAVTQAKRFIDEAGCDAVKLEWFDQCLDVTSAIIAAGIPVMGHVGLTPQRADELGGMKVQGKTPDSAQTIIDQAVALEKAGCFSLVLECVPAVLGKTISDLLTIPTIGIGAGPHCDGQVLVLHDLLGLYHKKSPKFALRLTDLNSVIKETIQAYAHQVRTHQFPALEQSF